MRPWAYRLIAATSVIVGIMSLAAFFMFIFHGPLGIIQFNKTNNEALVIDFFLSMIFIMQHSIMIRQSVKKRIIKKIPSESFYAFFSIISGATLLAVIILWQESPVFTITIDRPYSYFLFLLQFLAILGLVWAIISLKDFDPFGRKQISNYLHQHKKAQEDRFVYKGPYHYVRHPFYFFILVMMWSHPVISADRLLFICLWTGWVVFGAVLEEKDLVYQIGDGYHQYQKKVPMLIPYKNWRQLIK